MAFPSASLREPLFFHRQHPCEGLHGVSDNAHFDKVEVNKFTICSTKNGSVHFSNSVAERKAGPGFHRPSFVIDLRNHAQASLILT